MKKDVKTPADLKGKKVAGPKGTVLNELLVAALNKEGMTLDDIEYINMGIPNAVQAMLSGKVDCALAAAASVVAAEKNGARILVTCEGYVSPLLISACSKDFAAKHPAMLKIYTDTYKEALKDECQYGRGPCPWCQGAGYLYGRCQEALCLEQLY